jgi:hypothetical protein
LLPQPQDGPHWHGEQGQAAPHGQAAGFGAGFSFFVWLM